MAKGRSPLAIIFVTILIDLIGFGIVIPILPLYADHFGASATTVGFLLAVYSTMQFVCSPILGRLSDRVGRRPVLLLSILGTSLGFLIMGLAQTLWLLFLARILDGVTGGNISTAAAYIADVTPPEERSRGMGLIGAAFGIGLIIGPAVGGLMSRISMAAPFFFASGLAAANAVALYFLLPESLKEEHRDQARRDSILRIVSESVGWQLRGVLVTAFFATLAFSMLTATLALFTNKDADFLYDATHNGYLFAYMGLIGATIQGGLIGRLSRAFGDKTLAVAGALLTAAGMFLLPISLNLSTLALACAAIGIGNSLLTPTLNALASKAVDAASQGSVLGVMSSVGSLARILGPPFGGWLLSRDLAGQAAHFGRAPYWATAIIMLVGFAVALTLRTPRVAPEPDPVRSLEGMSMARHREAETGEKPETPTQDARW
jgi:DHA1 family tetracycline resistance protein-like MFS transporter